MPHPTDIHIGRKIREKRVELGMSQSELANELGITFQQVQKYESGANRVAGSRIFDISQILGVEVKYFFEGLDAPRIRAIVNRQKQEEFPLNRQTLEMARAINAVPEKVRKQVIQLMKAFVEDKKAS